MSHISGAPRGGSSARGTRGGARGGRVKKGGPAPARHIPWPEIFKHHISLVEGHFKMIDMVRKHTVEGSGNHRTICDLLDRASNMLKDAKATQREFIVPRDAWRHVPIGSSSETMYPGYSPKDHQYGKAAEEFGRMWSEAKKKGVEFKTGPDGPEYQFNQGKAAKKRRLSGNEGSDSPANKATGSGTEQNAPKSFTHEQAGPKPTGTDPLFFFDSNPSPLAAEKSNKKAKQEHNPISDAVAKEPQIESDNIDAEVEARLKLKADSKGKKDKKRKRESAASNSVESAATALADTNIAEAKPEKPVKKKSKSKREKKSSSAETEVEPTTPAGSVDVEMEDVGAAPVMGQKEKKKKAKKEKKKLQE